MSNEKITVDILAIGAHPDDADLTCGGTLARCADQGYRVGILDLTRGETGTRGTAELRAEEAQKAAKVLGVGVRLNAGLPDAHLANDESSRSTVVNFFRELTPRIVLIPAPRGLHPDHSVAAQLCRDAFFLAKLKNYPGQGKAFKSEKLIHAIAYREDTVKPTFVVDTTETFKRKIEALQCYSSQFAGIQSAGELFPTGQDFYELVDTQDTHYGSLIRTRHGEPFLTDETVRIDDVVQMGVASM